jgi:hypothetical protein
MYLYVALRGPTYRENSHANHTWYPQSGQTACFKDSEAPSLWVPIPIARSTLKATPGHAGLQDWGQDIDPMGKSWEIDAEAAVVSWPHVSPRCPEIHTYSHTQQFPKIICVIPTPSPD